FQHDDVRYPESLVTHFLERYTRPGDTVLDPFAGYGTTLRVAERLKRSAYGLELNPAKVAYTRSKLQQPQHLLHGDARALSTFDLPPIDFSITSPPYMHKDDYEDPFTDYQAKSSGYPAYLRDLRSVYAQLRDLMKPGGTVVLEVSNLKQAGRVTALAWDIAAQVSQVLHFEGEVIICWDQYGYGYDHSYCLVYTCI
ncbi:MAG: hypothetical protein JW862_16505, partial [Anaerolineales bacterium]|nr:hypothetical protein [Anaerolineales bacterium]